MKIIFYLNNVILKNEHLNVDLNRVYKNCIYSHKISNLEKMGCKNNIVNLFYFQVNGALKGTCVLSNYACYNHNT